MCQKIFIQEKNKNKKILKNFHESMKKNSPPPPQKNKKQPKKK